MKIKFWGTRGSLPASINANNLSAKLQKSLDVILQNLQNQDKITSNAKQYCFSLDFATGGTYGTNTSCVQIDGDGENYIILDAGTGLRDLGNHIMKTSNANTKKIFHIFLSHLHWDHIQGFPFFIPAYIPGNKIIFYGAHPDIKKAFEIQQSSPFFPVSLDMMAAEKKYELLSPSEKYEVCGYEIEIIEQNHPGKSFGYSFKKNNKKIVYSTDSEHKEEVSASVFLDFFKDADALIFDAQYTLVDSEYLKCDWGHSSNLLAVEFACLANVKNLIMFHSEPVKDDFELDKILHISQN
ncbi:MAG TPA: MBL fold metallo-hydrolase, partial [bacterium]|nr:MBL fold metallo-hydrolase [bacterium]